MHRHNFEQLRFFVFVFIIQIYLKFNKNYNTCLFLSFLFFSFDIRGTIFSFFLFFFLKKKKKNKNLIPELFNIKFKLKGLFEKEEKKHFDAVEKNYPLPQTFCYFF